MNRRSFLRVLGLGALGAAASMELDLERLLWVPGAKTIVLPPAGGWWLSPDWLTREALKTLENNLTFMRSINRQYEEAWPKVAFTVKMQRPQRLAGLREPVIVVPPGESWITVEHAVDVERSRIPGCVLENIA